MKLYQLREEDKQFLASLLYATGIILFWRGIWEISYELPLLENVYFVFFVGLFILTITGYMYKEFDVFSEKYKKVMKLINNVAIAAKHGEKHYVYYYDESSKQHHKIEAHKIKKIEHDNIVLEEKGREIFIPLRRVSRVHKGEQVIWKR